MSAPAQLHRHRLRLDAVAQDAAHRAVAHVSRRSRFGLYTANFLLAELVGVLIPLLNDFLLGKGWRYDAIGLATAMSGLGLLVIQLPVGILLDRVRRYRRTLMWAALAVGGCFGLLPGLVRYPIVLDAVMFLGGAGQAFIVPLLGTLALGLAGHAGVNALMGDSQAWNHAGNIATSLLVVLLVRQWGTHAAFLGVTCISVLAAASCFIIRRSELRNVRAPNRRTPWCDLWADRRLRWLLACSALFHLANAAVTPIVAMYSRTLSAPEGFVTNLVLGAQLTMAGAAWAAGRLGDSMGRKPVLAFGFIVLPVRIIAYALLKNPYWFMAVAVLDGLAVGIYNVVIASICADIDAERGYFNTLLSMAFATLALGNVVSPLVGGLVVQHWGFHQAFYMFAALAVVAALLFVVTVPETRPDDAALQKMVQ